MRLAILAVPALVLMVGCSGDGKTAGDGDSTPGATAIVTTRPPPTAVESTEPPEVDTNVEGSAPALVEDSSTVETTDSVAPPPTSAPTSETSAATDPDRPRPDPESGGTATGALGDSELEIETDEGVIQIGVAEVPVGVSDTFPIPADLDVQLSSATDTDFGFSGVSALSIAELAEFYDTSLAEAGYTITERQEVAGVLAVYTFERADEFGQVAISGAPGGGGSSVLVTIGDGTSVTEVSLGG